MNAEPTPADAAADPCLVFIERARCPECGSTDLQTQRSTRHGDDSISRRTKCRSCGLGFTVIVE